MKMLVLAAASALAAAPLARAQAYPDRPYGNDRPYVAPERADAPHDRRDDDRYGRADRARVIDSRPVYGAAGEHEECWNEQTSSYERHHIGAGTVIGGIAGGVVGHQFGSGRGNTAATAAGAIGGALLGNRVDRDRAENDDGRQRCRTVRDESDNSRDVIGYDVRYRYQGREYETRLDHPPGRWLEVGRETRPDGRPLAASEPSPGEPRYDRDRR
ncbi:MAG TPA: glycine zipper 2TM domain-containing protein [Usitatibacter sp.]|nr:glycine zipper 2TM domain-containing protein [Usitatibacter sp.]